MTREIGVRLFGAFRQYATGSLITVSVDGGATVGAVRTALDARLADDGARSLLAASAFASDERVLDDGEPLSGVRELAVLPPVCGG